MVSIPEFLTTAQRHLFFTGKAALERLRSHTQALSCWPTKGGSYSW